MALACRASRVRRFFVVPSIVIPCQYSMKAGLVIIDEVGFETFTREEANLAFP
jgi:hypothetical protein